jgi:hypothetical protein
VEAKVEKKEEGKSEGEAGKKVEPLEKSKSLKGKEMDSKGKAVKCPSEKR